MRKLMLLSLLAGLALAQPTARVGYVNVLPAALPLVADAFGLYEEAGLEVELTPFGDGPTMMQALIAGQLDAVYVGFAPAYLWAVRGAPIKILSKAANFDLVVLARADSGIQTPQDLAGRRVGVLPKGSMPDVLFRGQVLKEAGLKTSDLTLIHTKAPNLVPGLATGQLEAAVMLEPWTTIARLQLDLVEVYDINQAWPESTGPVLATTERVIAERPGLLRALLQAHKKAATLSETQADAVNRLLAQTYFPQGVQTPHGPVDGVTVIAQARRRIRYGFGVSEAALRQMEAVAQMLKTLGYIPKVRPITEVVDLSLEP
ncbi:ABC transporter substrate-binding protein [Marinithermus hydrothermalis]|uniref:ABC transporter substrate-binding protein n=1 Tax=Marinithermus hydrothermalis (strain DSM 14884 / JCM 11576 / T1) TaxID=869210 RepID=F2NPI3_MARHT|nr:ABC transporter substrate-binding protein [Marinithermus hydrothermalis]AEB12484.1 ABC transporter substrate-binding protein [Marinithermus hydrothermalis DSM 14884]